MLRFVSKLVGDTESGGEAKEEEEGVSRSLCSPINSCRFSLTRLKSHVEKREEEEERLKEIGEGEGFRDETRAKQPIL